MLKIEAIFRPERVGAVADSLLAAGVTGFHYQNVTGQGQQKGVEVVTGRGGQTTRSASAKTLLVTVISAQSGRLSQSQLFTRSQLISAAITEVRMMLHFRALRFKPVILA